MKMKKNQKKATPLKEKVFEEEAVEELSDGPEDEVRSCFACNAVLQSLLTQLQTLSVQDSGGEDDGDDGELTLEQIMEMGGDEEDLKFLQAGECTTPAFATHGACPLPHAKKASRS